MTALTQSEYQEKVYKYKTGHEQIKAEAQYGYIVESIEVNNGIYSHVMGMEYPEKGIASTHDIFATNQVKRLLIESARLSKYFIPSLIIFALLPFKYKLNIINKFFKAFNDITFKIISPNILQFQHLTPMAQELHYFLNTFFNKLGLNPEIYEQTTEILINVINFDNAYRYRLQDLFHATTLKRLKTPYSEFRRLLKLQREREMLGIGLHSKFKLISDILLIGLFHPKIYKAYQFAIDKLDIEKVQPDKADWFWMCVRTNYNYFGLNDKEREALINNLKFVRPTKL